MIMRGSTTSAVIRRAVLSALIPGVLLAVTACGSKSGGTTTPNAVTTADVTARPAQPYDILHGVDLGLVDFAKQRVFDKCLADAGYPQNKAAFTNKRPGNPLDGLVVSA